MEQGTGWSSGADGPAAPVARLIEEFHKLPGVGPKSAQRLTYHLLRMPVAEAKALGGGRAAGHPRGGALRQLPGAVSRPARRDLADGRDRAGRPEDRRAARAPA